MLRKITDSESILIKDDPVRPHFTYEWRTDCEREVWVWDSGTIDAVICVAYTNEVPRSEEELEYLSQAACQDGQHGSIAVFYTVWSYAPGAGRKIVNNIAAKIAISKPSVKKWVTLSPLTAMAENFHISNGAKLLEKHQTCQNFDYTHLISDLIEH